MLVWWWSDTCVEIGSSSTRCDEGSSSKSSAADIDTTPNIQLLNPPVRVHMVVPSVGTTAAATTAAATLAAGTTAASRLRLLQCYSRYISFSYPVCVCGSTSRSSLFDSGGQF